MQNEITYLNLINAALIKNQRIKPKHYTLRAIAKRIDISHSLLSKIFTGKKKPSQKTLQLLYSELEIDQSHIKEIEMSLIIEKNNLLKDSSLDQLRFIYSKNNSQIDFIEFGTNDISKEWQVLAVLSLISNHSDLLQLKKITHSLNINENKFSEIISLLVFKNIILIENNQLKLVNNKGFFITNQNLNLQKSIFEKICSLDHMSQALDKELESHFIKCAVINTSSEKINVAKEILKNTMVEVIGVLTSEDSSDLNSEVVALSFQLIDLIK